VTWRGGESMGSEVRFMGWGVREVRESANTRCGG
jgi:hypothetical protein